MDQDDVSLVMKKLPQHVFDSAKELTYDEIKVLSREMVRSLPRHPLTKRRSDTSLSRAVGKFMLILNKFDIVRLNNMSKFGW